MCYKYSITILTPTFNRGREIKKLYQSLVNQTNQNFQWLIIDDGSTDNTKNIVESMSEGEFKLDYYRKNNGGKHTALNFSHRYILGELVCIVDSDDWLIGDAIQRIVERKNEFFTDENVKMLSFLRGVTPDEPLCNSFPPNPVVSNHIDFRINSNRRADCCEIVTTDVFKEFPFPEHSGEKFLGEGVLWNGAGFKYDTVYIPEVIYICQYLDGGLTKSGRRLRLSCPLGGMDNSNSYFVKKNTEHLANNRIVKPSILKKEAWLFICYGKLAGMRYAEIENQCKRPDLIKQNYLPGCLLYLFWKYKYKMWK